MYDYYFNSEENKQVKQFTIETINNEKVIKIYELHPTLQKSYYGKAKILETNSKYYLLSYYTVICSIDKNNNNFCKYWNDYSKTTMLHINDFLLNFNKNTISKKQWESINTSNLYN